MLTEVFSHSSVYRIGGDEFMAVVQRRDYQNRDALLRNLQEREEEARELEEIADGKTEFRIGTAVYDPESDVSVADVIRRALAGAGK